MTPLFVATLAVQTASISVEGASVLEPEAYAAIADVGDGPYDEADASRAQRNLRRFLDEAGYALATVSTEVGEHGELRVEVDEGHLDKIVVPDRGALAALAVRAMIDLPQMVFNQHVLHRQLERVREALGIEVASYRVVPVGGPRRSALDLDAAPVEALGLVSPAADYRLELRLESEDLSPGFGLGLSYRAPDGLLTSVRYRFADVLLDDDRFEAELGVGVRPQDLLGSESERRLLSVVQGELRAYSPRFDELARVYVDGEARFVNRQRLDLDVDSYDFYELRGTSGLHFEAAPLVEIRLGAGISQLEIIGVRTQGEAPAPSTERPALAGLAELALEIELGQETSIYRHQVEVEASTYIGQGVAVLLDGKYEKVFPIGWDELEIAVEASGRWGDVLYPRQRALGRHLTAIFGNEPYPDTTTALRAEYRFSLVRDRLRLGVFHDGAVYHVPERLADARWAVANSFGVGLYGLFLDGFDFGLALAHGFRSDGPQETGVAASLRQVF